MPKHKCSNAYHGDGAKGACYVHVSETNHEGVVFLEVGHSCVKVHDAPIPVSWLAELVAIATLHEKGIEGFLADHMLDGGCSYALSCDPKIPNGEIYVL